MLKKKIAEKRNVKLKNQQNIESVKKKVQQRFESYRECSKALKFSPTLYENLYLSNYTNKLVYELPYDCVYTKSKLTLTICNNIHSKYFNRRKTNKLNVTIFCGLESSIYKSMFYDEAICCLFIGYRSNFFTMKLVWFPFDLP